MTAILSRATAPIRPQSYLVRATRRLAALVFLILPTAASALVAGEYHYKITNAGTAVTLTRYTGENFDVEIPATLAGLPVTGLGSSVFADPWYLSTVFIPASVTRIAPGAFSDCDILTAIRVDVSNPAYSSLEDVLFDKSRTTLIEYPQAKAGDYTLPDGVVSIGDEAFASRQFLTGISIPASVTQIATDAFQDCYELTRFQVDTHNPAYSSLEGVLFDKSQTKLIKVPEGKAGDYTLPDGVVSIGSLAFDNCGLTSVTIPGSVTRIESDGFGLGGGWLLMSITVDVSNSVYSSLDGVLFDKNRKTLLEYPAGKTGSYTIPSGVTNFGYAFYDHYRLEGITIPSSVTRIGDYAFYFCAELKDVRIPESVTSIGEGAFSACSKLTDIKLPDSVTRIENETFGSCFQLTDVALGKNVTRIGDGAFASCEDLTSIRLPDSVVVIGDSAFNGCNLKRIVIPPNVTRIGDCAFYGVVELNPERLVGVLSKAIFLGDAPKSMGSNVFDNAAKGFKISCYAGSKGFTSPKWKGYPTDRVGAEIAVQQPAGSDLNDGRAKKSFGSVVAGKVSPSKTFTIKNRGTKALKGLTISKSGLNARDFIVADLSATSLSPGQSATFKIRFQPTTQGTRNAAIHLKSNDLNKKSFDIKLTGMGVE